MFIIAHDAKKQIKYGVFSNIYDWNCTRNQGTKMDPYYPLVSLVTNDSSFAYGTLFIFLLSVAFSVSV